MFIFNIYFSQKKKIKKLGGEVKCKSLMSNDDDDGITPLNPKKSKR